MSDYEMAKQDLPESLDLNNPDTQALLLLFFLMAAKDVEDGEVGCSQSPTEI